LRAKNLLGAIGGMPGYVLASLSDRALPPPTPREQELIEEFRRGLDELVIGSKKDSKAQPGWNKFQEKLRDHAHRFDPREFTRWQVIRDTMFITDSLSVAKELDKLRQSPEWDSRWRNAIRESRAGRPRPFFKDRSTSGNVAHLAHHLHHLEQTTGKRINQFDQVMEFGGGYGGMCRLVHNLGFNGRYLIFDLPAFSQLQRFYLQLAGLTLLAKDADPRQNGIVLETDPAVSGKRDFRHPALFLATWSLSETPFSIRAPFMELLGEFDAFLIAYHENNEEGSNLEFFRKHRERLAATHNSSDTELQTMPKNRYWVGWKK
jgi:hypothetical protein